MNKSSQPAKKSSIGPMVAGVVGAAVGATAGVLLSNKDNRRKITETISELQSRSVELRGELKDKAQTIADDMSKQVTAGRSPQKKTTKSRS